MKCYLKATVIVLLGWAAFFLTAYLAFEYPAMFVGLILLGLSGIMVNSIAESCAAARQPGGSVDPGDGR